MSKCIEHKYDFMLIFDCKNGNPNGDPDSGNLPRTDPITHHGLVTDVCLKRKIRNYVEAVKEGQPGFNIYVTKGKPLQSNDETAFAAFGIKPDEKGKFIEAVKSAKKNDPEIDRKLMQFMAENYYDIRAFGAVMTTFFKSHLNWGQVTGPVQISFAESVDPVSARDVSITRVTVTKTEELMDKGNYFGKKSLIPYGLYVAKGHISAHLAKKMTGFSEEDLELFWEALVNMFDFDHSASRGEMVFRGLLIFEHDSLLGNCHSHKLFDSVTIQKKEGVDIPVDFNDYVMSIDSSQIPENVRLIRK